MEIPDLPSPDLGDLGSISLHAPLPLDPLPARSSSPPLPPRKNALGLPPTYLNHLRALLHQWLEQQRAADDPLPGSREPSPLWSETRLAAIEQAVWQGAVIPDKAGGKKRLLDSEWTEWAPGSLRRKKAWKEAQATITVESKKKSSRASSMNDDKARGKLSLPPMSAVTSTPKSSTRPPSIASTDKPPREDTRSPLPLSGKESDEDAEEKLAAYLRYLASLRGYQRLVSPLKEEWEVLEGKDRILLRVTSAHNRCS